MHDLRPTGRRPFAAVIAAAGLMLLALPAYASLFGGLKDTLRHVDPTPPPDGQWNFVSPKFAPDSYPSVDQVVVVARCRFVAPKTPYQWQFEFANQTSQPLKFRVGLVQINNQAFATVNQHFSKIEPESIQRVSVAPHRKSAVLEEGRYGCPGMPGGVNKDKHYVVMLDDLFVGSQNLSKGVFDQYDREIDQQHSQYIDDNNDRVNQAAAAGINDGLSLFSNLQNYEVPQVPEE